MTESLADVLLVDDEAELGFSLARGLKMAGVEAEAVLHLTRSVKEASDILLTIQPQVVVMDLCLDKNQGVESGFALLKVILEKQPHCRVVVLTGHSGVENGIRALEQGAANFLEKPADLMHLAALIKDGIRQANLRLEYDKLRHSQAPDIRQIIVGSGEKTKALLEVIAFAASTEQPVMITGETGTGKGLCAQAIHGLSARSNHRFVRYQPNFSSADIVNSDLFGHVKGAFTGAEKNRRGLMLEAYHGSLFLDEIDELPIAVQVSLLGVIQDKKFRALGADEENKADFRLICATNRPLEECLQSGKLRKDFYHRVAHLKIEVAPLRERVDDIEDLTKFFLERYRERDGLGSFEVTNGVFDKLKAYSWPGNIRELQAVVENAAGIASFQNRSELIPADIRITEVQGDKYNFQAQVDAFKKTLVNEALVKSNGNEAKAAQLLDIDRGTLRRILGKSS